VGKSAEDPVIVLLSCALLAEISIHTVGKSAEDPVIVLPGCALLAEIFPEIIVTCVSTTF
jgi:hypothetical protein